LPLGKAAADSQQISHATQPRALLQSQSGNHGMAASRFKRDACRPPRLRLLDEATATTLPSGEPNAVRVDMSLSAKPAAKSTNLNYHSQNFILKSCMTKKKTKKLCQAGSNS